MKIKSLFFDIGGVMLTNGWDQGFRKGAAAHFHLEWDNFQRRHKQIYDLHEKDLITLDEYLQEVIFWKERPFSMHAFKTYMQEQSQPLPGGMLQWIPEIKEKYGVSIVLLSNEGRDLATYRIHTFKLASFADISVVSCFVKLQKPDPAIYKMALDLAQVKPGEVIYIDDRLPLVQAGAALGLHAMQHVTFDATRQKIEKLLQEF